MIFWRSLSTKIEYSEKYPQSESGGVVGAEGMMTYRVIWGHPGTNTKHSQIVFAVTSISLSLVPLGTKLKVGACRAVSNRESRYPRDHLKNIYKKVMFFWSGLNLWIDKPLTPGAGLFFLHQKSARFFCLFFVFVFEFRFTAGWGCLDGMDLRIPRSKSPNSKKFRSSLSVLYRMMKKNWKQKQFSNRLSSMIWIHLWSRDYWVYFRKV